MSDACCPHCGYCKHCGRGPQRYWGQPYNPYWGYTLYNTANPTQTTTTTTGYVSTASGAGTADDLWRTLNKTGADQG